MSEEGGRWFTHLADHLQSAYLRYSFTKGSAQEVAFLIDALGLEPGHRVLDVGCGPGRHLHALRDAGIDAVGVDISESFCRLASGSDASAPVAVADARNLPARPAFDAVISLCQGGFGLLGGPGAPLDPDAAALTQMAAAIRPGGRLALSAFSAYFQVRHQAEEPTADFDTDAGVMHETTTIKDEAGTDKDVEMWTTGFTPRELRLLTAAAGLEVEAIWSVEPGDYARRPPEVDLPEFLLLARQPT